MHGTKQFPRSIQLDNFSCGPRAAYSILKFFGKDTAYAKVFSAVKCTSSDGTSPGPLIKLFRKKKLVVRPSENFTLQEMKKVLKKGGVLLVSVDGDHYATIHGWSKKHAYVADPSIVRLLGNKQRTEAFLERWDRWGLAVYPKNGPTR